MKPNIQIVRRKATSVHFCTALSKSSGGKIVDEYTPGPWAGFGAPELMDDLNDNIDCGHDYWFADHAYFGRGVYFRVTKNALQHTGKGQPDFKRLKPFWEKPKPWKKDGSAVVICAQTPAFYQRSGIDDWIEVTKEILHTYTDREIIVREKSSKRPLMQDLENAYAVVCHTSNVGVESIMNGIPVITTGKCAATAVAETRLDKIESLRYPDDDERMEWAATLAANQWTLEEIAKPEFWENIK